MEKEHKIDISVDIKQVKYENTILQGTEAMTIIRDDKKSLTVSLKSDSKIPFAKPLIYSYGSLTEDYIFKYAILQDDELLGILYLEIPYRYKFSKKFKIDDWFAVKPYEKATVGSERFIMARVVIKYSANCKLNQDVKKNLEGVEIVKPDSPKKEFKGQLRDMNRSLQDHSKEGFSHLEEVEKKIRARRLKGSRNSSLDRAKSEATGKGKGKENHPRSSTQNSASVLGFTLTRKKQTDLGV